MSTVLIVDDEPAVRSTLSIAFQREGHHVLEAPNGKVAMSLVQQYTIHGVLTDINMPVMDGLTLCTAVRCHEAEFRVRIPLWIMTGALSRYVLNRARDLGVNKVFTKPFELKTVVREVEAGLAPQTGNTYSPFGTTSESASCFLAASFVIGNSA